MKKTIGILTLVCAICITVATAHAYSTSKTTTIEYGKYIANIELAGGPWMHTIMEPSYKNLPNIFVDNYIYRKSGGSWQRVSSFTFDVRNTTLRFTHDYLLDNNELTRSSWIVSTKDGKIDGKFTFGDGKL